MTVVFARRELIAEEDNQRLKSDPSLSAKQVPSRSIISSSLVPVVLSILLVAGLTISLSAFALLSPAFAVFSQTHFQAVAIPTAIATNPEQNKLYVVHEQNFISVMDAHSGDILSRIYLDEEYEKWLTSAVNLAINSRTNTLYATSISSNFLYIINGTEDKVVGQIQLHGRGNSIAVNEIINTIYVVTGGNELSVIDGVSKEIIATIDIGDHFYVSGDIGNIAPAELSINPFTNLIYATNAGHNVISVINGSTNAVMGNITAHFPYSAVINPSSDKLYLSDPNEDQITVLNGTSFEVIAEIPNVYSGYFGNNCIAVDEGRNTVYAMFASRDAIAQIDGNTDRVINVIKTDIIPEALAVDDKQNRVFVTTESSARILVMDNSEESPSSVVTPPGRHPVLTHLDGSPFQDMEKPGQPLIVSYEFYNDGSIQQSNAEVVAIIEIRDEEGVTISLGWYETNLSRFTSTNIDMSWMAEEAGSYWIHTMLISGSDTPQPIGNKSEWGIEVANEI